MHTVKYDGREDGAKEDSMSAQNRNFAWVVDRSSNALVFFLLLAIVLALSDLIPTETFYVVILPMILALTYIALRIALVWVAPLIRDMVSSR